MNGLGQVNLLNVGAGDIKLSFDPKNPAERVRAARIVADMCRRGYALLIRREVDGEEVWQRATGFDETSCEYLIADFDPLAGNDDGAAQGRVAVNLKDTTDGHQEQDSEDDSAAAAPGAAGGGEKKAGRKGRKPSAYTTTRVPAERAVATAVGRTAGG